MRRQALWHWGCPLVLGGALLVSCRHDPGVPEPVSQELAYETMLWADPLKVTDTMTAVFRTNEAWTKFLAEHWQRLAPSPPAVDFGRYMLVGLFWGWHSHGCDDLVEVVERVVSDEQNITIEVGQLPELGPCRRIATPLQVIRLDTSDLPVRFTGHPPGG
jgi:hypothetical protein